MIVNVFVKFYYDRLRIEKALGFLKSVNNKKHKYKKLKNNVRRDWRPPSGSDDRKVSACLYTDLLITPLMNVNSGFRISWKTQDRKKLPVNIG